MKVSAVLVEQQPEQFDLLLRPDFRLLLEVGLHCVATGNGIGFAHGAFLLGLLSQVGSTENSMESRMLERVNLLGTSSSMASGQYLINRY